MKRKILTAVISAIFLLTELTLGAMYQISALKYHDLCGFALVVLACLFCAMFFKRSERYLYTQLALMFTVGADYLLVVLDEHYTLAVILFFFSQMLYMLRILADTESKRVYVAHVWVRCAVSLIALLLPLAVLKDDADALSIISVVYYANLILNAVFAFIGLKFDRRGVLFAVGLLLFVGCDLFVGLSNLSDYISLPANSLIFDIMYGRLNIAWLFYAPSQALLGISLLPYREYKREIQPGRKI